MAAPKEDSRPPKEKQSVSFDGETEVEDPHLAKELLRLSEEYDDATVEALFGLVKKRFCNEMDGAEYQRQVSRIIGSERRLGENFNRLVRAVMEVDDDGSREDDDGDHHERHHGQEGHYHNGQEGEEAQNKGEENQMWVTGKKRTKRQEEKRPPKGPFAVTVSTLQHPKRSTEPPVGFYSTFSSVNTPPPTRKPLVASLDNNAELVFLNGHATKSSPKPAPPPKKVPKPRPEIPGTGRLDLPLNHTTALSDTSAGAPTVAPALITRPLPMMDYSSAFQNFTVAIRKPRSKDHKPRVRNEWKPEEDEIFLKGIAAQKTFAEIAASLPHRNRSQVRTHFKYLSRSFRQNRDGTGPFRMIKTRGRPPSRLERKCREPDLVKALQTSIQQFHVPTQQKPPGDPANKPFQHMIQHFHAGSSSFATPPPSLSTTSLPVTTSTQGLVPLAPNPKTFMQPPVPIPYNTHFYAVPQGPPRAQPPVQNSPIMPAPQRIGQHPLVAPHPLIAPGPPRVKKEKLDEAEEQEDQGETEVDVPLQDCPTEVGDGEYVVDYFANYQGENLNEEDDEDEEDEDEDDEDFDDEEDKLTITVEPIKSEPL